LPTGGRTLQIIRAKVSDGGEYTCVAINQAGESKKKVSLTVYGLFTLFSYESFIFKLVLAIFYLSILMEKTKPLFFYFLPSVPPSIKDHGSESLSVVNVREGTSVSLECGSNAVPPPVITWYKNGRMLTESARLEILADGQMLHITKAEVHLLFLFVCRA